MKKGMIIALICTALLLAVPSAVYADIGPKPSVQIEFVGIEGAHYYGTLLSKEPSTGPASAWDGVSSTARYDGGEGGRTIWEKFVSYEDEDGFYFLQEWWDCSEDNRLDWTYFPPSPFKILLYFPDEDLFYVSPIYERYAFDSYFTVDLTDWEGSLLVAEASYKYEGEIVSLFMRVVLTILLELGLAWLFGYRERRQLTFLAIVNLMTQIALNVSLNVINYRSGPWAFVFYYILLELLVFAVEAGLYRELLPRYSSKELSTPRIWGYAFVANAVSFVAGLWLAQLIPGIF